MNSVPFFSLCIFSQVDFLTCSSTTVCDVLLACVLIINRECGCSHVYECAKQGPGICLWTAFICFSWFSTSMNLFSKLTLRGRKRVPLQSFQKLREMCFHWLSSLCVFFACSGGKGVLCCSESHGFHRVCNWNWPHLCPASLVSMTGCLLLLSMAGYSATMDLPCHVLHPHAQSC